MKRISLLIVFLSVTSIASAQLFKIAGHEVGFIYVGPKLGMNFSKISNWSEYSGVENKSRIGYQIGAVGEIGLTNRFSFQTELTFISKGTKIDDTTSFDVDSKIKTGYLGIPLLAKMSFNILGLRKVYAMGGSYQNIRTGGEMVYNDWGEPLDNQSWRRVDWGLLIGAGAEYPMKYGNIGLDLRYELGLLDVHTSDAVKNRNSTFSFSLVYKYDVVDLFLRMRKNKLESEHNEG